jgi:hypothetical protein
LPKLFVLMRLSLVVEPRERGINAIQYRSRIRQTRPAFRYSQVDRLLTALQTVQVRDTLTHDLFRVLAEKRRMKGAHLAWSQKLIEINVRRSSGFHQPKS